MRKSTAIKFGFHASILTIAIATSGTVSAQENPGDSTIVVTGQRAQQAAAIEEKRDALGVIDAVSTDEIGRLPDRNVAELIERLPGVGVQYDQGEGRYVAVRGVPSSLNGYTINGFEIGNPDGNTRALPLDIVSGQLLNRVEVQKVKTPDLIGQGIGGTINLVQQTAFDFDKPFIVAINGQIGFQQLNSGDNPYRLDGTVGGRFGEDEEFGILLGASYSYRPLESYGMFPDDWFPLDVAAPGGVPINLKYSQYLVDRKRLGLAGSFDWRRDNTQLYVRGVYSRFTEDEYRQRFRFDFASQDKYDAGDLVFDANGLTGTSTDTQQRSDLRLDDKRKSIMSIMTGGSTEFDQWKLDFGGAYSYNKLREIDRVWQFRGNPGDVAFDFTDLLYSAVPVDGYLAPSEMEFRSFAYGDLTGKEDIWQARFNVMHDLELGSDSFFKVGGNFRWNKKVFDDQTRNYARGSSGNRFSMAGLAGDNIAVHPETGLDYYIAPVIDRDLMVAFTADNLGTALMPLDEASTLADQVLADYTIKEDIYAGYAMANLDFDQVSLTAGLRMEHTKVDGTGFALENETDVVSATNKGSFTDWLPSAVLRWKPVDDVIVRLAYSRSVGRPNYEDLKPGGALEYALVTDGIYEGNLALGNANLKPYRSNNADISAEWYFARGGLLSVAGIAKWIDNPIFTVSNTDYNVSYGGREYSMLSISQPRNAESGHIYGVEFSWQQQFTMLPGLLSGLGVNANLTLVSSKLKVPDRASSDFPEQSNLLIGAQLFYQKDGVQATVGYNMTGHALIDVGNDPIYDQYNDNIGRLDAKISYDINDHFTVFAQGQNLTDEPTRQYQGGVKNWVIQRERYGRVFWIGGSARW